MRLFLHSMSLEIGPMGMQVAKSHPVTAAFSFPVAGVTGQEVRENLPNVDKDLTEILPPINKTTLHGALK